jgi:hypothetical protein
MWSRYELITIEDVQSPTLLAGAAAVWFDMPARPRGIDAGS